MNRLFLIVFSALFIQNAFPQGSAWMDISVPGLNSIKQIISGNNSDLFVSSGHGLLLIAYNFLSPAGVTTGFVWAIASSGVYKSIDEGYLSEFISII